MDLATYFNSWLAEKEKYNLTHAYGLTGLTAVINFIDYVEYQENLKYPGKETHGKFDETCRNQVNKKF